MTRNILITLILLFGALLFGGCTATVPGQSEPDRVNDCSPDEGLVLADDGTILEGITQCAICRRYEDAYVRRAAELGCDAPYPLDGCPIDEGQGNCQVDLVVDATEWMDNFDTCKDLVLYAGSREMYGGHECGDSCTWTNPYADPLVTSSVADEYTNEYETNWDDQHACCPGTSYAERATNVTRWDCGL